MAYVGCIENSSPAFVPYGPLCAYSTASFEYLIPEEVPPGLVAIRVKE